MSRAKTIRITRHPEVVTMYRIMQGDKILRDNLETLDSALHWQAYIVWLEMSIQRLRQLKPLTSRDT